MAKPPQMKTVTIAITEVVVNIKCLCSVNVFRIARAKAIAPLKPKKLRQNKELSIIQHNTSRNNYLKLEAV